MSNRDLPPIEIYTEERIEEFVRDEDIVKQALDEAVLRRALLRLMHQISRDVWSAGWKIGLEYDLWAAIHGEKPSYPISEEERCDLKELAQACGGWWMRSEEGEVFVDTRKWREIYNKHLNANTPDGPIS